MEKQAIVQIRGLMVLILLGGALLNAASGGITGTVVDAATGLPLAAANVRVEGTQIGAASNLKGVYDIPNVPPGVYNLIVTYIGYEKKRVEVQVTANQKIRMDMALENATVQGKEVVITAQAAGQRAAINQQINAVSIKNVVSSARIQELPDATAAESIGRLPGISINRSGGEANKVTVRGLAPRFNNVQLDGVTMRSTDTHNRSTDISMIAPNMLSGVEVTKALTPDMEAASLGGTINLTVREAPDELTADLLFQGGFDAQEDSYDNYKIVGSAANRYMNKKLGVYVNAYAEKRNRSTQILNPDFIEDYTLPIEARDESVRFNRINFEDQKEIRKRFGGSLVLDYRLPNGSLKLTNFASRMDRNILAYSQRYDGRDGDDLGWNMNKSGKNEITQMVNRMHGQFDMPKGKLDFSLSHSLAQRDQPEARSIGGWGKYDMSSGAKDSTHYLDYVNVLSVYYPELQLGGNGRNSYESTEREYTAQLNYQLPYNLGRFATGSVKVGGMFKHNARDFDRESLNITVAGNTYSNVWDELLKKMPDVWKNRNEKGQIYVPDAWDDHWDGSQYLNGAYPGLMPFMSLSLFDQVQDLVYGYYDRTGFIPDRSTNSFSEDQDGTERMKAGYLMTHIDMFDKKLTLIPGVRYEHMEYEYKGTHISIPLGGSLRDWSGDKVRYDTTTSTHENWFPMVHLRAKPAHWFDVRLAWTNTASRPNYTHIVPYRIVNPNNKTLDGGNPALKPQISENWDLYASFYSNKIGLFTVGVFAKDISDLIWKTQYFLPDTNATNAFGLPQAYKGYKYNTPLNSDYAGTLKGLELEWQTHFWYLPFPFNGMVLNVNYTYMESETRYPWPILVDDYSTFPPSSVRIDSSYAGPIAGQPENVVNVSVGYDYKGFSGRVSYLYQDGSLSSVNQKSYLSTYGFSYSRVDIKLRQKLPVKGLELFLNLNNLTDTGDRSYIHSEYYIDREEYWGMTADIGLRYRR